MNEMDQNEPSKGTKMNWNVPTRAQLTKISQNRRNPDTKMNQMGWDWPSKGIECMKQNVPTRTQLTNINQNKKNPVTQNALNGFK